MHIIAVRGMRCRHCEMLLESSLEDHGAKDVHADHEAGTVTFEGDLSQNDVEQAVLDAGFALN